MKKISILLILVLCFSPVIAGAVNVTLDDGTVINLDSLSTDERNNMIKYMDKINRSKGNSSGIAGAASEAIMESAKDPAKLNEWRKLITGTIRDVANDLNITVNEFVKTPAGTGVAALIFYKVAGKDIFSKFIDIILAIPFWFTVIISCAICSRAFLGYKTEYKIVTKRVKEIVDQNLKDSIKEHIPDNEDIEIKIPQRICRYNWSSDEARTFFAFCMIGISILTTIVCFTVVFL